MSNSSTTFKLVAGLLALALFVGGAGVAFPGLQLALNAAALIVAGYFVVSPSREASGPLDRWALAILGLMLLLPIIQLIPLPPALWQLLPGRELPKEMDAVLAQSLWRPWTLDVEGTIRSWLVLIPGAVVFIGCLRLRADERTHLLKVIMAVAMLSALLGAVQAAGEGILTPYVSAHIGFPVGLFVNRNHQALLLLTAIPLLAAVAGGAIIRGRSRAAILAAALTITLIFASVAVATTSRTALLLLLPSLAASILIFFAAKPTWRVGIPVVVGVAAIIATLFASGAPDRTLERFAGFDDSRYTYWSDVEWAFQEYDFAGTGFGSFVPVSQSVESLEAVGPNFLNHAHNDFIEVALEGGLPAALLVIAFFGLMIGVGYWHLKHRSSQQEVLIALAAATGVALILIFSLIDYPLRMPAISCTFAVLVALLLPTYREAWQEGSCESGSASRSGSARPKYRLIALLPLLALLMLSVQAGMSSRALLNGDPGRALMWASWSTRAYSQAATDALIRGNYSAAEQHALSALHRSPIDVGALRTLGAVQSSPIVAYRLMDMAAQMGWRDKLTQVWAIDAALKSGESQKAVQRASALFRQNDFVLPSRMLLAASRQSDVTRELAAQLSQQPKWRDDFLRELRKLPGKTLRTFVAVVDEVRKGPAPITAREAQLVIDKLIDEDEISSARQIWLATRSGQFLTNPGFEEVDGEAEARLPTSWGVPLDAPGPVLVARPDFDASDQALRVSGRATDRAAVSQLTMLSPGNYVLAFNASSTGQAALRWEFRCRNIGATQVRELLVGPSDDWQRLRVNFDVPDRDCATQRLALKTIQEQDNSEVWLDDLSLDRVPR